MINKLIPLALLLSSSIIATATKEQNPTVRFLGTKKSKTYTTFEDGQEYIIQEVRVKFTENFILQNNLNNNIALKTLLEKETRKENIEELLDTNKVDVQKIEYTASNFTSLIKVLLIMLNLNNKKNFNIDVYISKAESDDAYDDNYSMTLSFSNKTESDNSKQVGSHNNNLLFNKNPLIIEASGFGIIEYNSMGKYKNRDGLLISGLSNDLETVNAVSEGSYKLYNIALKYQEGINTIILESKTNYIGQDGIIVIYINELE